MKDFDKDLAAFLAVICAIVALSIADAFAVQHGQAAAGAALSTSIAGLLGIARMPNWGAK